MTPITHNLTMVRFNDLTYTIPAWVQTVLLGLQLTTEEDLAPSGIDTFQRLWYPYYRRNKQTNKHKWPSIVVQGSKGWDQSMGHYHCNRTSGAPESLHPAWNNLMRCIFPVSIYEIVFCNLWFWIFSLIFFLTKKRVFNDLQLSIAKHLFKEVK